MERLLCEDEAHNTPISRHRRERGTWKQKEAEGNKSQRDGHRQTSVVRKQTAVDAKTVESVFSSRLQRLSAFSLSLPLPSLSSPPAHMPWALCMSPRGPCPGGPSSHPPSSCCGVEILASQTGCVNLQFQGLKAIIKDLLCGQQPKASMGSEVSEPGIYAQLCHSGMLGEPQFPHL